MHVKWERTEIEFKSLIRIGTSRCVKGNAMFETHVQNYDRAMKVNSSN